MQRTYTSARLVLSAILLASVCAIGVTQTETASVIIQPVETWSNVFASKEPNTTCNVDFHFHIKNHSNIKARIAWSLFLDNAVIQREEIALAAKPETAKITLRIPYVREGLVVDGKLAIALILDGQTTPAATFTKTLRVYPYQPFYQRTRWLKELNITLYDPGTRMAARLRELAIPFTEVRETTALADIKSGVVLIGEGASFAEEPDLPATLNKLAANGLGVLCLAPTNGMVPIPEAKPAASGSPASITFARTGIIRRLDKKLDTGGWAGDGKVITSAFALKANDGAVVSEVTDGTGGWPWLDIHYPGSGRLVYCGFSLVNHWDAGPTPRFLLARILESLKDDKK